MRLYNRNSIIARRRQRLYSVLMLMAVILGVFPSLIPGVGVPVASAHNLDASAVYVFFDANTQAVLDARINGGWTPGVPILQSGDELGMVIKAVPDNGTTTGVGGYTTYYIPNGVQVIDAAFLVPGSNPADGIDGYDRISAKGQALIANVGAGGGPTVALPGLSRGPNVAGVTANMWGTGGLINNGTLPGVYGDLGIFYSTAPETAYGSYTGGTLTNNSGDTVGLRTPLGTPLNEWDAWQLAAFGIAGTANPAYPGSPLIDSNGRGNTGWGLANAVAGPQSGYAWQFNKDAYDSCDPTPTTTPSASCINTATQQMGPWQRIQYPGSQIAYDVPGDVSAGMFNGGLDGSTVGFALSPSTPLTATTGQSNGTPNAIRFALGQLTYQRPEYVWVKIKVQDPTALVDVTGCPVFKVDTFGGDAGGDDGGKDHIWRYYDPNSASTNGCLALGKPATREIVKVGDTFQYKVKAYNLGTQTLTNVIIRDTLPSGVTFVSAVPAQNSGPNPLQWNLGNFLPGQKFEATVTVKASGSGILNNCIQGTATGTSGPISATACEKTPSGQLPYLKQSKSVSPTAIAPGGQVQYTVLVENIGTGATGSPVLITEDLPSGFTYGACCRIP